MAGEMMAKLQMKAGQRLALINPPVGMQMFLVEQLAAVDCSADLAGAPDGVLAFVRSKEELAALAPLVFQSVAEGGLAWIAFPKGGSGIMTDLNRDKLWAELANSGWRPVRNVAIDAVWSALRFRPAQMVGK